MVNKFQIALITINYDILIAKYIGKAPMASDFLKCMHCTTTIIKWNAKLRAEMLDDSVSVHIANYSP